MIARVYDVLDCGTEPAKFYKIGVAVPEGTEEARVLKWVPINKDGDSPKFEASIIARMPARHLKKMLEFLEEHVKKLEASSCMVMERAVKAIRKG